MIFMTLSYFDDLNKFSKQLAIKKKGLAEKVANKLLNTATEL